MIVIDFYIKYIGEKDSQSTHIYSTMFFKKLVTDPAEDSYQDIQEKKYSVDLSGKRYARVKNWTKNMDVFTKGNCYIIELKTNQLNLYFLKTLRI